MKVLRKLLSVVLVAIIFINMTTSYAWAANGAELEITQVSQPRMQGDNGMSFDLTVSSNLPTEGVIVDIDSRVTMMGAGAGFNYSGIYGYSIGSQIWLIFDSITSGEMASIADGAIITFTPGSFTLSGVSYSITNGFKMKYNAASGIWSTIAEGNTNDIEITQVSQPRMQGTNGMSFDLGISSGLPAEGVIADIGALVKLQDTGDNFDYSSIYGYSIKSEIWLIFDNITSSEMASIADGAKITFSAGNFTLNGEVYNIINGFQMVYDANTKQWHSPPIEVLGLKEGSGIYDVMPVDDNYKSVVFDGIGTMTKRYTGEGGGWLLYLTTKDGLPGLSNDATRFTGIQMSVNGGRKFSLPIIHSSDYGMAFIHLPEIYLPASEADIHITLHAGMAESNNSYEGIQLMNDCVLMLDKNDNWLLDSVPMWRVCFDCDDEAAFSKDIFTLLGTVEGQSQEITAVYDGEEVEFSVPLSLIPAEDDVSRTLTLAKGTYAGRNGSVISLSSDMQLYFNRYGVSLDKGIIVDYTDVELALPKDGNLTSKTSVPLITRHEDVLSANGELLALSGTLGNTCYLGENGCNVEATLTREDGYVLTLADGVVMNGTEIHLQGLYKLGETVVSFQPIILIWNEHNGNGSWCISLPNTYVQGDANGDGILSIKDIVRVQRYIKQNENEDTVGINFKGTNIIASGNTIDGADTREMRVSLLGAGQIEMAAYSGPGFRYDISKQNEDNWISEQDFQDYIDCGFTYLFPEGDAAYNVKFDYNTGRKNGTQTFIKSDLYQYMELAQKMNIPVVPFDYEIVEMVDNQITELSENDKQHLSQMIKDLSQFDVFKGVTLRDEPSIKSLTAVTKVRQYLDTLMPNMLTFTSNHPMYCGDNKLLTNDTSKNLVDAYTEYVDNYSNAYGTFAYDSYPLLYTKVNNYYWSTTPDLEDTWFQNLEIVAQSAKAKGYDPGITIQSTAYKPMSGNRILLHKRPITSKADVGFQMYTALAYGMKSVNYYVYWAQENSSLYSAMIDYKSDGTIVKTAAYDAVREVNWEIKQFDHVLLGFDWQGTKIVKGSSSTDAIKNATSYSDERILSASSNRDAVIGCMKDEFGHDGYMLVNATDPGNNQSATLTVTFDNATKATAYIKGVARKIVLNGGSYTFELEPGEGVFVVLE